MRDGVPSDMVLMPRELTAENGAKALLIGEFFESAPEPYFCNCGEDGCECCRITEDDDLEETRTVTISWTTIKAIYAKAVEHLRQEIPSGCGETRGDSVAESGGPAVSQP